MSWFSKIFKGSDNSLDSSEGKSRLVYFDQEVPEGNALCSDDACPCSLMTTIPQGTGYLYIENELVKFRSEYRSQSDAAQAMVKMMIAKRVPPGSMYRIGPVFICERGARLRKLDLHQATADAKYWWDTGKVPLRATSFIETPDKEIQDPSRNMCTPWKL